MKNTSIIILALGILFFSNINAQTKKESAKTIKSKVTFSVEGMTCEGCVANVTKTLNKTKGVLKSEVSLKDGSAVVEFDNSKTTVKGIKNQFKKSAYKIEQKIDTKPMGENDEKRNKIIE